MVTGRSELREWDGRTERRVARAERRDARWDRPRAPKDWRYFVGGVGRVLIVIGLLMFGFVAYQLWGTGLEYAQAQNRLDDELEDLFAGAVSAPDASTTVTVGAPTTSAGAAAPSASTPSTTIAPTTTAGAPTSTAAAPTTTVAGPATDPVVADNPAAPAAIPPPAFQTGDAMARIEIPQIDLDAVVVAGVEPNDLKKGPGHYPGTPMPGQLGNSAIAGHRTTYGQPFFDLDDVAVGDEIVLTTVQGRFVYRMTGREIVPPSAGHVVLTTDPNVARLTLTTCDPKYTATNRLIVYAELDTAASGAALPPVLDYGGGQVAAGDALAAEEAAPTTVAPDPTVAVAATPPPAAATVPGAVEPVEGDGTPPAAAAATTAVAAETAGTVPGSVAAAATEGEAADDPTFDDAFAQGWFHDTAAWPHVIGWGLAGAAVAAGGYLVARSLRRYWAGFAVAVVPFVVVLYFFYQNVNRLLPAAI